MDRELEMEGIENLGKVSFKKHGITHLDVDVTDECNLGCSYCYHSTVPISSMKPENWMQPEVQERLKEVIKEEQPTIAFFGGEPLVRFATVRDIVESAKPERWTLTSNLTLLDEKKEEFFIKNRGSIHCSIDGSKTAHDQQRYYKNGHPSFEMVKKNVPKALNISPGDTARGTVTPEMVELMFEGVTTLVELGFKRVALMPVLEAEWTEETWRKYEDQLQKIADWNLENPMIYVKNLADCLRKKQPNGKRCGAGHRMVSSSVDGSLYPCHRFSQKASRGIGEWYLGNINDPDLDSEKLKDFRDRFSDTPEKCKTCPAYHTCSGGCPHVAYSITGSPEGLVDNHCEYMLRGLPIAKKMYSTLEAKQIKSVYNSKVKRPANRGLHSNKHFQAIMKLAKEKKNGKHQHAHQGQKQNGLRKDRREMRNPNGSRLKRSR